MLAAPSIQKRDIESRVIIEKKDSGDNRSPYLHDHDRIIYSRTFRRLAFKTQVVPAFGRITSDHIRSRLTHSLEVMQIASSIALKSNKVWINGDKLDIDLIHSIALGHDLGHTAYGHIGEKSLFDFIFKDDSNEKSSNGKEGLGNFEYLNCKIKHSFQSLKICCFLEKQYKPDFCGLNLTIATLDGILKHSNLADENERRFYKQIFGSYQKIFLKDTNIDNEKKEKLNEILFGYVSPVTYEGIIVSLADDIAQLCHDIEDIRRLGKFKGVKDFYTNVNRLFNLTNLPNNMQEVYDDFSKVFNETLKNSEENIIKLERLYIKLILGICIPLVSKIIQRLVDMDESSRERLLKNNKDLCKFKNLRNLQHELKLELTEIKLLECLKEIFNEYQKALFDNPAVAKWDMKGKELYFDLHKILYKAFKEKDVFKDNNEINLKVLDYGERESIKKSYDVGKDFEKSPLLEEQQKIDGIPIKFAVWDYLAGMTDNFIIKSYEELTFKRVELR